MRVAGVTSPTRGKTSPPVPRSRATGLGGHQGAYTIHASSNPGRGSCRQKRSDQRETTESFVVNISFEVLTMPMSKFFRCWVVQQIKAEHVHRTLTCTHSVIRLAKTTHNLHLPPLTNPGHSHCVFIWCRNGNVSSVFFDT